MTLFPALAFCKGRVARGQPVVQENICFLDIIAAATGCDGSQPGRYAVHPRSARHQRLAAILREARKAAGLQQVDLAQALGRHQPFVANIESAQRRVDVIEFLTLVRLLNLDPAQVLHTLTSVAEDG